MSFSPTNKLFPKFGSELQHKNSQFNLAESWKFIWTMLQVAGIYLLLKTYNIGADSGLMEITPYIGIGLVVHYFLPFRFRLPWFVMICLAVIQYAFGWKLGLAFTTTMLGIIWISNLPIKFNYRLALIFLIAVLFGAIQVNVLPAPIRIKLIVPYIAGIFMFRLMVYLYEIKHKTTNATLWEHLGYFFMFPNLCFLLFPIVDFKSYLSTYFNDNQHNVYQKGIRWLLRGAFHIMVYRYTYHYLFPTALEVENFSDLVQHITFIYFQMLQITGIFYIILGLLALFGMNLPLNFNWVFLASSFSDIWRRINIYWRDFMIKIFYYPVYFRVKKLGFIRAIIFSTVLVFIITWALHSYQTFWINGFFPMKLADALFWGILGGSILTQNTLAARKKKKPTSLLSRSKSWTVGKGIKKGLSIMGIFFYMALLWSLWSSSSVSEWFYILSFGAVGELSDYLIPISIGLLTLGVLTLGSYLSYKNKLQFFNQEPPFVQNSLITSALILLLLGFVQLKDAELLPGTVETVVHAAQKGQVNEMDQLILEQGYYENLLGEDAPKKWQAEISSPVDWENSKGILTQADNELSWVLLPNVDTIFKGARLYTNEWQMRDEPIDLARPDSVYRLALVGGSITMGSGVENHQTFEWLTEQRLNEEKPIEGYSGYEILNFACRGYLLPQHMRVLSDKVPQFDPNALVYVSHTTSLTRLINAIARLYQQQLLPHPFLEEIAQRAGLRQYMSRMEVNKRLLPYKFEIYSWGMNWMKDYCAEYDLDPFWVFIPETERIPDNELIEQLMSIAREAGFTIIDLRGVFDGYELTEIQVADYDEHPSVLGHQLITEMLLEQLLPALEKAGF